MAFSIAPIENGASPAVSPLAAPHREAPPAKSEAPASEPGAPKEGPPWQMVLHVGCGPARQDSLPSIFRTPQWRELRLDIDPGCQPDLVGSITSMTAVESGSCTAVFSSHNLEHLQPHEVQVALAEFVDRFTGLRGGVCRERGLAGFGARCSGSSRIIPNGGQPAASNVSMSWRSTSELRLRRATSAALVRAMIRPRSSGDATPPSQSCTSVQRHSGDRLDAPCAGWGNPELLASRLIQ